MVKKLFAAILCLLLVGCGPQTTSTSHKIKVVTTTFPSYDALRAIIGNDSDYDLHMLLKPGADAHSYEPSPEDIIKVENADMFVYTGGDSDTWVNEILTDKKHGKVIKLMDLVEKREEEEAEPEQIEENEPLEEIDISTDDFSPPPKRPGFFAALFGAMVGVNMAGGLHQKRHNGRCNGDCAHCPPHYGYRYGRWYYGHDHVYGCEFGGNKGSGSMD